MTMNSATHATAARAIGKAVTLKDAEHRFDHACPYLPSSLIAIAAFARQRRRRRRFDMTMACRVGDPLKRVRHAHQLVVVPGASHQLNVDRLASIVVPDRKRDAWNAVRRARRVAAAETRLAAAAVVQADVAQQSGVHHSVNRLTVGGRRIHPLRGGLLATTPVNAPGLDLRLCQRRRRWCEACARSGPDVCDFPLRALHVDIRENVETLCQQLRMAVDVAPPSFRADIRRRRGRSRWGVRAERSAHWDDRRASGGEGLDRALLLDLGGVRGAEWIHPPPGDKTNSLAFERVWIEHRTPIRGHVPAGG